MNEGERDKNRDRGEHEMEKREECEGESRVRVREKSKLKRLRPRTYNIHTYIGYTVKSHICGGEGEGGYGRRVILVRVSKSECNNAHSSVGKLLYEHRRVSNKHLLTIVP